MMPALVKRWRFQELTGESSARFSPCEGYRYELARTWDVSKPRLTFVGLNPSTADAFQDDPTIRRIIGFARSWGCGALRMFNAFALRSTDPKGLLDVDDPIGPENDSALREDFESARARNERVVLGWGNPGILDMRGAIVAGWAIAYHGEPECFGLTQNGQPKHPLYLPGTSKPVLYRDAIAGAVSA